MSSVNAIDGHASSARASSYSPHHAATQARKSLEHVDTAAYSLQRGMQVAFCCLLEDKGSAGFGNVQKTFPGEQIGYGEVSLDATSLPD